ncbi:MAG: putative hydrolase [Clostridia bacterium]|nr:putative hydrolase [Clostridia bacterium]
MKTDIYTISSSQLSCRLYGKSDKTIVIDSCIASCSAEWWHIAEQLQGEYQVLLYDRAGYGKSSLSIKTRTPENIAAELDDLLNKLGINKNIIMIGHSQGGFYATQYALMFPQKMKAVVLLDPATPFDIEFIHNLSQKEYKYSGVDKTFGFKLALFFTRLKLGFLFKSLFIKSPPFYYYNFSDDAKNYLLSALCKKETYKTALEEYKYTHLTETSQKVIDGVNNCGLKNIPIILMTHSSSIYVKELKEFAALDDEVALKVEALWQDIMKKYLKLSTDSKHIIASNSGHYIHLTDNELLESVIKAL